MRKKLFALLFTGSLAAVAVTSCNSQQKKAEEAAEGKDTTSMANKASDSLEVARKNWEQFKSDMKEQIRENNDSIAAFKERMKKAGNKAGNKTEAKYNKMVADLEQKNNELQNKLDNYKDEGQDKWEKFKTDFKNDMDTFKVKMKDAFTPDKKK